MFHSCKATEIVQLRRIQDAAVEVWRNGEGTTQNLVSMRESSVLTPSSRPWRLSIARLERPTSFSRYSGLQRTFIPIGSDLALKVDGRDLHLDDRTLARFDGESDVALIHLDQPCHAVNLMTTDPRLTLRLARAGEQLREGAPVIFLLAWVGGEAFDLSWAPAHRVLPVDVIVVGHNG